MRAVILSGRLRQFVIPVRTGFEDAPDNDIKHRHEKNRQQCARDDSTEDSGADGILAHGAGT